MNLITNFEMIHGMDDDRHGAMFGLVDDWGTAIDMRLCLN